MRYNVYFFIIFLILFGCNNNNNNKPKKGDSLKLEKSDEFIKIHISNKEVNNSGLIQYFYDKDTNYLATLNSPNSSIDIYNLDNQSLSNQIKIKPDGKNAFPFQFGFTIKNRDTIILISNFPPTIGIMDGDGNILNKFLCQNENSVFCPIVLPLLSKNAILEANKLFIMQEFATKNYSGEFTRQDQQILEAATSVNIRDKNVKPLPIKFPELLVGKDIFDMTRSWTMGYNGSFVCIYSIMNNLFVTQDFSEFKEISLQTEYKLDLPTNVYNLKDIEPRYKYLLGKDALLHVHYDKYREVYYLIIRKREKDAEGKDPYISLQYPNGMIVILDKEFRNMGEVHLPSDIYRIHNYFVTPKGLYISEDNVNNPSYNEDLLQYRLFKLIKN